MISQSVAWGTVRIYLSALRYFQIRAGLPDPSFSSLPRLPYILKGIRRQHPDSHKKPRLPITIHLLRQLHTVWSTPPILHDQVMLWAACCMGFFGFLRAGEFTCTGTNEAEYPLTVGDITVDSREDPRLITVYLKRSKTDPFGAGCRVFLGRTGTIPCPVAAILSYLSQRPTTPGPLFIFQDGTPLTRTKLVSRLREALAQTGIDTSHYSGHSFRIGAATAAARAGYSDSFIQALGRWKSDAFITYIRANPADLAAVAPALASNGL